MVGTYRCPELVVVVVAAAAAVAVVVVAVAIVGLEETEETALHLAEAAIVGHQKVEIKKETAEILPPQQRRTANHGVELP